MNKVQTLDFETAEKKIIGFISDFRLGDNDFFFF